MRHLSTSLSLAAILAFGALGNSCAPGGGAADASDQIMLVRQEPPSFGYQRLNARIAAYPDLGVFVAKRGVPDYLAETSNRDREYFILYYLKDRNAYACRTRPGNSGAIEFAGPYPITPREYKTLEGFRKKIARPPEGT